MDRELLYWFEVFLEQEVCSTTSIFIKSYPERLFEVKKG